MKVSRLKVSFWVLLFKMLGLGLTFKILESSERKAIEMYSEILDSKELSSEEREVLKKVLRTSYTHSLKKSPGSRSSSTTSWTPS